MNRRTPGSADELRHVADVLGDLAVIDAPLASFTTYRVGGSASIYAHVESINDLHLISAALRDTQLPLLVIGRGSNLLVADEGFKGLVLTLGPFAETIVLPDPEQEPVAIFGGSVSLPVAARQSVHRGLSGFEWAVGVPGSIGGAVRMNAGGHGSEMATSVQRVRVYHLRKGVEANVQAVDLGLRFRGSALTDHHIVLSTTMRLMWGDVEEGEKHIAEIVHWRRENQPGGQNAGSVFVNPQSGAVSAGALIDQLGLRGTRVGTASVSEKHANFIQADVGGSAIDVVTLMAEIRRRVRNEFGFDLRSEIRLAGFDSSLHPELAEVIESETDTSIATIRFEQVFGGTHDASIPLNILRTGGDFVGADDLDAGVLEELRDVFAADQKQYPVAEQHSDATSDESGPDFSADFSDREVASRAVSLAPIAAIVIVDEDLRKPKEVDFPDDERSQTASHAPTSTRIIISDLHDSGIVGDPLAGIDDGRGGAADDEFNNLVGAGRWSTRAIRRRLLPKNPTTRRRRTLVAIAALVGASVVVMIVLSSPLVAVKRVDVEGAQYTSAELVQSVVESLKGHSVLTVDTRQAERRLESNPWVESARVQTFLPNRAVIEIAERTPVAWFVGVDNRARVLDSQGRVIDVVVGQPTQYRQIVGVGPNLTAGAIASSEYQGAAQLAVAIPAELDPIVANFGVGGPNVVTMTLTTGTVINFGKPVDVRNKLISIVVILRRQDPNGIESIDVSTGVPVVETR
jgi:UDP-N-acetylmuramate dehydrogenase